MADIDAVLTMLAGVCTGALYPAGTGQTSIAGVPCRVYPGWPQPNQLDADMAGESAAHVSIYPRLEATTVTVLPVEQEGTITPAALTLTVAGQQVTVGGTVSTPQNLCLLVGGTPYTYSVLPGDTLSRIATELGSQIAGATVNGVQITLPATAKLQAARVGTSGEVDTLLAHCSNLIQVTAWAWSPMTRAAVAEPLWLALLQGYRQTLSDGSQCILSVKRGPISDSLENRLIYRRDIFVEAGYFAILRQTAYQIVAGQLNIDDAYGNLIATRYS